MSQNPRGLTLTYIQYTCGISDLLNSCLSSNHQLPDIESKNICRLVTFFMRSFFFLIIQVKHACIIIQVKLCIIPQNIKKVCNLYSSFQYGENLNM